MHSYSSLLAYICINQLRSMFQLDFVFFLFSCTPHSSEQYCFPFIVVSILCFDCVLEKRFTFFSFFFTSNEKARKKGNENALNTQTSRSHFICMCFAMKSTDKKKEREGLKKKRRTTLLKSQKYIHGCLMKEMHTNGVHIYGKRKKQMDISLRVVLK